MPTIQNQILDAKKVAQKIKRIAYEIYERNFSEQEIAIIGIAPMGSHLSQLLAKEVASISHIQVQLGKIELEKFTETQSEIKLDLPLDSLEGKVVILVDDVLNTGKTLAYSVRPFLNILKSSIRISVFSAFMVA